MSCYSFKYKTAAQIAEATGLSVERIEGLCRSGLIPHVFVDGRGPLFSHNDTISWIRKNLVDEHHGTPIKPMPVLYNANPFDVPVALSNIAERLIMLPACCFSGIYFLCEGNDVVYVGQSVNAGSRSTSHRDKQFNSILILPVPEEKLNEIESAFIGLLKPKYNKTLHRSGNEIYHAPHAAALHNPKSVLPPSMILRGAA